MDIHWILYPLRKFNRDLELKEENDAIITKCGE